MAKIAGEDARFVLKEVSVHQGRVDTVVRDDGSGLPETIQCLNDLKSGLGYPE